MSVWKGSNGSGHAVKLIYMLWNNIRPSLSWLSRVQWARGTGILFAAEWQQLIPVKGPIFLHLAIDLVDRHLEKKSRNPSSPAEIGFVSVGTTGSFLPPRVLNRNPTLPLRNAKASRRWWTPGEALKYMKTSFKRSSQHSPVSKRYPGGWKGVGRIIKFWFVDSDGPSTFYDRRPDPVVVNESDAGCGRGNLHSSSWPGSPIGNYFDCCTMGESKQRLKIIGLPSCPASRALAFGGSIVRHTHVWDTQASRH